MIDAHAHVWQLRRHGQSWPPARLAMIHRDFVLADWQREVASTDVRRVVLVQSQPDLADTRWLLQLARADAAVAGVVGWVDLARHDAGTRIRELARSRKLRGLRVMLENMTVDDWVVHPMLDAAISVIIECGLTLDVLVRPRHLAGVLTFAQRHTGLRIVIDHAAKPDIAGEGFSTWVEAMTPLVRCANVYTKLSGLVTEAAPHWTRDDLAPYVTWLVRHFGADRLMWGSDWPVVTLASTYSAWLQASLAAIDNEGANRASIFERTAATFYGLR